MANQYSDVFTYGTFGGIHDWRSVSYRNVTLLKDICGKKTGATVDEIRLDTTTGKFTVPRSTRSNTELESAAKTLVEFKGVHTRFSEEPAEPVKRAKKDKSPALDEGESSRTGTVTLKFYENKRKLFRPDSSIKEYVIKGILKALNGKMIEESTGPRGELLVNIRTSIEIEPKTLTEFTVCTARNRIRTCYYARV